MKLLIVLRHPFELWNPPDWVATRLRQDFPQVEVVHLKDYAGIDEQIRDAEIVIAWSLRPEQIKSARNLRWVHSTAAAVHQLIFPELVASDIVLTNARDVHGPVVAEHVIALVFALAKRIPQAIRLQQKHVWGQKLMWETLPHPREIAGATLGLVGLGSIGCAVATHAFALGMRVIAVRESILRNPCRMALYRSSRLLSWRRCFPSRITLSWRRRSLPVHGSLSVPYGWLK